MRREKFIFIFGKYKFILYIDYYIEFANVYFNKPQSAEKLAEYKQICKKIDEKLREVKCLPKVKCRKQNKGGKPGEGKHIWGRLNPKHLDILAALENELRTFAMKDSGTSRDDDLSDNLLPEEIENAQQYIEGASKRVTINSYERNSAARKKCIKHYGYICSVCDFDFFKVYGKIGKGYIHVHHIIPLAKKGEKYELDPIKDLIPVCPNCHSMIHRKKLAMSVEELKRHLNK